MDYRVLGFLIVVLFGPSPSSPPFSRERERETTCWEEGGGMGEGAESYYDEKAQYSIIH
jgi:hypothetical protein